MNIYLNCKILHIVHVLCVFIMYLHIEVGVSISKYDIDK